MEFPKTDGPVIIATKGLPFTDRQTLSARIAEWTECPIFSMHAILKLLSEENGYGNPDSVPSKAEVKHLNRLGFSILCTMARANLKYFSMRRPKCVVIESPLSNKHQLRQLLDNFRYARIIIVECRVKNKHRWRLRYFEERIPALSREDHELFGEDKESSKTMWFAPKNWEDAEKAIKGYDAQAWNAYFHRKCFRNPYLRRLVLDPKRDLRIGEFEQGEGRTSTFVKALEYILTSGSQTVVELEQWRKQEMERRVCSRLSPDEKSSNLCKNGECFFTYEAHLEHKATCMACDEEITHQAYTCHFCTLALHKPCAELRLYTPEFLYYDGCSGPWSKARWFGFSEVHACKSCKVFSYDCTACVQKTHLKCRMMPTIIKDECHEHILAIHLASTIYDGHVSYNCQACGGDGGVCSYFCMFCKHDYHVRCAMSPRELEHEHGGYNHLLKLKFSREDEEEEEDYWCDVCLEDMDPECWFYTCQQCLCYVAHLYCVMDEPEHEIYLPR